MMILILILKHFHKLSSVLKNVYILLLESITTPAGGAVGCT